MSLAREALRFDRFNTTLEDPAQAAGFVHRFQGISMPHTTRNKADVEYAVMLAVLNFQKDFIRSPYSHIQVQLRQNLIEVSLTRSAPIPAEERLAQTEDGRAQLKQMHQALFAAGQHILKTQLTHILGEHIAELVTDLDPLSGKNTIVIRLNEASDNSA